MDAPQVLHYAVGQTFTPHVDFFDPAIPSQATAMAVNGQRVATALVYLNDAYDGGDTDFRQRARQAALSKARQLAWIPRLRRVA